ncbi:hypothetical protein Rsub_06943 [Raphidocelis subcapitata]|uniref:Chalcone-flavonone isomerase family protein n=1 Tax=Raphidocelis subcapitata TaxID=307507 RepID=A0A2V0P369_9CHLO|nr:hypothetical protein Rsub_06943 [Raphidocelis subcapitata]|eukprot:GBF94321.1 hypothetical protein Rsub_06943 [Raphidocelis subcapitata]
MSGDGRGSARLVVAGGAPAMPWAAAARGGARHLAPASLTFGLPLGGAGAARGGRALPFASVSAAAGAFAKAQQESATGVAFPDNLCVLSNKHCPGLAGVGVRAKRILGLKNINVYALGLYVDAHGAKRALHKWKGCSADDLACNQKAFDALVSSESFERSLRLVISFGALKRQQFIHALEERLAPALKKAGKSEVMPQFERLFDGVTFKKGTLVDFSASGKGKLITKIDGKQVGAIESPELVRALFDIYLGKDPVSPDAKKSFGAGLASLLAE